MSKLENTPAVAVGVVLDVAELAETIRALRDARIKLAGTLEFMRPVPGRLRLEERLATVQRVLDDLERA